MGFTLQSRGLDTHDPRRARLFHSMLRAQTDSHRPPPPPAGRCQLKKGELLTKISDIGPAYSEWLAGTREDGSRGVIPSEYVHRSRSTNWPQNGMWWTFGGRSPSSYMRWDFASGGRAVTDP